MIDRHAAENDALELLDILLNKAVQQGADTADAVLVESRSLGASYRQGKPEDVERSESVDVGLRVMRGQKQAIVSTTDIHPAMLDELAQRANDMARHAPDDPYCGLADAGLYVTDVPDLDLFDDTVPTTEQLIERAREAEEAALELDQIKQSEGGGAGYAMSTIALGIRGPGVKFGAAYSTSSHSVSCSVIAAGNEGMERDYDSSSKRHFADLDAPAHVGRSAGERAVKRLGPRKMESGKFSVIYDRRVSGGLVGHVAQAINGAAVARGTTFLKDSLGKGILRPGISIIDDPHIQRGQRSRPVDGEGLRTEKLALVDDGQLQSWILDSATARQLGLKSTAQAARGVGSPPSPGPSNLYMAAGSHSLKDLIADIDQGFYVTELFGFGISYLTGDYSRGASGFWIENGEIAFPVSEMTVAGNLSDMFMEMTPADDLEFRYATNAPTIRIDGMTVAGA